MNDFTSVGKLMSLPLDSIQPDDSFSASDFVINAAAQSLTETKGHNWIPLIVQEVADYQYQAICHHFVYAVARQANLERVLCIVIEPDPKNIEQARILARETVPKANLNTANRDTITAALKYLKTLPNSPLKTLDVVIASSKIIEAADRPYWTSFAPVSTLKCALTKGKKLDALSEVFYLDPQPAPPPDPKPLPKKTTKAKATAKPKASSTRSSSQKKLAV